MTAVVPVQTATGTKSSDNLYSPCNSGTLEHGNMWLKLTLLTSIKYGGFLFY
jgi:hypothetical protein